MGDLKAGDRFRVTVEGYARYVNIAGTRADVTLTVEGREILVGALSIAGAVKLASPLKVGDKLTGSGNPEPPVGAILHFDSQSSIAHRRREGWWHTNDGPYQWSSIDHSKRTVIFVPES